VSGPCVRASSWGDAPRVASERNLATARRAKTSPALSKVMRRPLALASCVVLLYASIAALPAEAAERVYVRDSTKNFKRRPDTMKWVFGAGAFLRYKQLRPWHGWGSSKAKAKGMEIYPDCRPDCATGGYKSRPAKVRLKGSTTCRGRTIYDRMVVRPRGAATFRAHLTCEGFALP
jgi:hypothetical protein